MKDINSSLLEFIDKSPTAFQAVDSIKTILNNAGFTELKETEHWGLTAGGKYYTDRNGSAIIAFTLPESTPEAYRLYAAHSDSPAFKIKEQAELKPVDEQYVCLNTEKYGGMLMAPWFDRPLSVAGRIVVKEDGRFVYKNVCVDRDLLMIPNLAIHMNREANDGMKYNPQKDLIPLFGGAESAGTFMKIVAEAAGVDSDAILGHDLFLYNRMKGCVWGANDEFISAPRLDDLQCAFAGIMGLVQSVSTTDTSADVSVNLVAILDNEEVGSGTRQGAASTFMEDVMCRIASFYGMTDEDYRVAMADSFMISADNAHAVHPNYTDKADPTNRPYLNGGIVIKYNANQKYCTDAISSARFRDICSRAGVPVQTFANRSDMAGGSTLGNIALTHVPVSAVDIGLPQLAMHSCYETAGARDTEYLVRAVKEYFGS